MKRLHTSFIVVIDLPLKLFYLRFRVVRFLFPFQNVAKVVQLAYKFDAFNGGVQPIIGFFPTNLRRLSLRA
jgi:hypothetical protein